MKLSSLIDLWKCSKYSALKNQNLEFENKCIPVLYEALELFKNVLLKGLPLNTVPSFLAETYKEEWFPTHKTYETILKKDTTYFARMHDYIDMRFSKGSKLLKINEPFKYQCTFDYETKVVEQITGRADFVFVEPDGSYEVIKMDLLHSPSFSYGARKPINMPDNSIALISLKLAFEEKYNNVKCSLWHLKGKNDSGTMLQVFEDKKGANIISSSFPNYYSNKVFSSEQLFEHLLDILKLPSDKSCNECFYKSLCHSYTQPSVDKKSEAIDTPNMAKKEVKTTPEQQRVINHVNGPMHVIAVPGAGKTFSLVQRMSHLIKDCNINPNNFLFLTFTNKATNEIRERVSNTLGIEEESPLFPNIFTFNAFCYRILRDNKNLVGELKLASDLERLMILKSVLNIVEPIQNVRYDIVFGRFGLLSKVIKWIDSIYLSGKPAFRLSNPKLDVDGVFRVFDCFDQTFHNLGYINYDDQINLVNQLFEKHPNLLVMYSKQFRYLMVDEYQDVNEEQNKLVCSLAKHHKNVVIVGDDDQSIYKFRGGSNKFMLNFTTYFPNSEKVIMGDNFRSNDKIVNASNNLIRNNKTRFEKTIIAHKSAEHLPIFLPSCSNATLHKYLNALTKTYKPNQIAFLGRQNDTLIKLKEALPEYKFRSPKSYLKDDSTFLTLYDIVSLYLKKMSVDKSLFRLLNSRGLDCMLQKPKGINLYQHLIELQLLLPIDIGELTTFNAYKAIGVEEQTPFLVFGYTLFHCFKILQYSTDLKESIEKITKIWFGECADNGNVQIAVKKLCDDIEEKSINSIAKLFNYMDSLILYEDTTRIEYEATEDTIQLLTAHDSKGKEFEVVIVHGIDLFDSADEEERRLLYVAMTRARNTLIITTIGDSDSSYPLELKNTVNLIAG